MELKSIKNNHYIPIHLGLGVNGCLIYRFRFYRNPVSGGAIFTVAVFTRCLFTVAFFYLFSHFTVALFTGCLIYCFRFSVVVFTVSVFTFYHIPITRCLYTSLVVFLFTDLLAHTAWYIV